jgi:uncharacterized protein YjbI with pentapeptide repeats
VNWLKTRKKPRDAQRGKAQKLPNSRFLFLMVLAFVLAGVGAGVGIYFLLQPFADAANPSGSLYDIVRTTATILGVITVGGAAAIQYRKQRFTEASVHLEEAKADLERDMKYAALLTTAIEHLGNESPAIRRGALYELRRLAIDSEKDRESVLEILVRHAKEKAEKMRNATVEKAELESEVKTTIEILYPLLRTLGFNADNINFEGIDFSGTNFIRANLQGAILSGANLSRADLSGAYLNKAYLNKTYLIGANLSKANLSQADLSAANLSWANLNGADLSAADLSAAGLSAAGLSGADLQAARLFMADLSEARLNGADLRGATVTAHQLIQAHIDDSTLLDDDVRAELDALREEQHTPTTHPPN